VKLLPLLMLAHALCGAAGFKAGLASLPITPAGPARLSGYAARTRPSTGVALPLHAKALALQDAGGRFLLITLDLVTIPANFAADVAGRIGAAHRIPRPRILLNCSHTHAGPVLAPNVYTMPEVEPAAAPAVDRYTEWLKGEVVKVAAAALANLAPARLSLSHGRAGFAANRRQVTPKGIRIGVNPDGPVDHDVPVISIHSPSGQLRGVIFAYACHPTTLGGDNLLIGGDYAGFAQAEVEKRHPGTVALFVQLCGADQNPSPRGAMDLAARHGASLAAAVEQVLGKKGKPLRPPLRAALETAELPFPRYPRERFQTRLADTNAFRAGHARRMLELIDTGRPILSIPYPVHAIRFGKDATLIALGGEVVIDYALRAKREFKREDTIVAGYSNDVMCYIPSVRVLREGGYEADDSLIYDGMPGPFADAVEETIFAAMRTALRKVGR
jgi:neutral ceramidase